MVHDFMSILKDYLPIGPSEKNDGGGIGKIYLKPILNNLKYFSHTVSVLYPVSSIEESLKNSLKNSLKKQQKNLKS